MACEASEQSCPLLSSDAAVDKAVFNRDPQAPESSVQQVVAPAVDKRAESPSACFLSLEQHQQKCAGCETLTKEVEKLAALVRTLTEENRLFRETLETLLKKKNVSIRELHPGTEGETPKVRRLSRSKRPYSHISRQPSSSDDLALWIQKETPRFW